MLYEFAGEVGSGKTLQALEWMRQAVASGRPVYTNIALGPQCPFYSSVALIDVPGFPVALDDDDVKEIERKSGCAYSGPRFFWEYVEDGALIVVDEGDIYFDSSEYGEAKRQTKIYHKQHRKFGHDIVYIVQRETNLYKRIRDLCSRHIVCEHTYRTQRIFGLMELCFGRAFALSLSRFFRHEFGDPERRHLRGSGHISYAEATKMFGWYDTKQLLGDTSVLLKRKGLLGAEPERVGGGEAAGRDESRGVDSGPSAEAVAEVVIDWLSAGAGRCGLSILGKKPAEVSRAIRELAAKACDPAFGVVDPAEYSSFPADS